MRILYITNNPSLRSTTCVLDAIFKYRDRFGIRPTIVFPERGEWEESLRKEGVPCYVREQRIPETKKPVAFLRDLWFWARIIKKEKIDLIHVNEHDVYPVIKHVARLLSVKVIVGVRFVLTKGFASWAFSPNYIPNKLLFTSNDQLSKSRDALPTEISENDVIVFGNGRDLDALVKNDADEQVRKKLDIPLGTFVLGTASAIEPRKRLEDFIRVVHKTKASGYPVVGLIAGGGRYVVDSYKEELDTLVDVLDLSENIVFLGDFSDIRPFYQSIDIFLSTSELETFGMSVCEAMAFSKPVVAFEGGSVREVLGDSEYTFDNYDCDGMTNKVIDLIDNPEKLTEVGKQNCKRVFENFNAPILAQKAYSIYLQLLRAD